MPCTDGRDAVHRMAETDSGLRWKGEQMGGSNPTWALAAHTFAGTEHHQLILKPHHFSR